jgi:hypothetical protein
MSSLSAALRKLETAKADDLGASPCAEFPSDAVTSIIAGHNGDLHPVLHPNLVWQAVLQHQIVYCMSNRRDQRTTRN